MHSSAYPWATRRWINTLGQLCAGLLAHLGRIAMVLVAAVCLIVCPVVCPVWCAPKVIAQESQQPGRPQQSSRIGIGALAKAPDAVWIESLIEADAAGLAVEVCRFHFDRSVPDSNAQAQWLMLLMHAKAAESLGMIEWNSGVKPLQDAIEQLQGLDPKPSAVGEPTYRKPWVHWKLLWCRRLLNEHALAAYLAVPGRQALQEWLLQSIRIGLDGIDALEQSVAKMQPDKPLLSRADRQRRDQTRPNEITASEILDLRGELELLRADLLYQRSQCYASNSDEQIAAATQMLSSIDRASGRLPASWAHRPLLTLARAEAELQLGRHGAVLENLQELWVALATDPNPQAQAWRIRTAALAVRSASRTQDWGGAEAWMARAGGWQQAPELALEHLGILVQRDIDSVAPENILALREQIADRFGRYWQQRVDAMLVSNPRFETGRSLETGRSPKTETSMASLELFRIQARQAIAANEFQTAIEKLQQGESAASKLDASQEAFQFAMQIAALLERTGETSAAADEFYRAAISYPESPKASSAGLMSAWLIRKSDSNLDPEAKLLQEKIFLQRLRETALSWPESQPAQKASEMLDVQWLTSGQYIACLEFWKELLAKDPQRSDVALRRWLLVALVTQDDWLEKPLEDPQGVRKAASDLQAALLESKDPAERSALASWMDAARMDAANKPQRRWSLAPVPGLESPTPSDLISQIAEVWNRCEGRWQQGGQQGGLRAEDAEAAKDIDQLEQLRKQLGELADGVSGGFQVRLDRFLEFGRMILPPGDRVLSDPAKLRQELEARISKEPKSLWWVYRSARAMQATSQLREVALGWYRQMAVGVAPGTEPWLEARARSIEILRALGQESKAVELGQLVLASYPNLSDEWKKRFGSN
jgi:hypothetical protein